MELPPPQPPPAERTTYSMVRQDVLWGRPIFRAPALTVFTPRELLQPKEPAFTVRRFRALARKKPAAA